jgi:nucleotide-binding universal stress UspA family protein
MFLLLFFQVNVAAITIRRKYGDKLAYGYIMPFFPVLPILAMSGMAVIAVFMFFHYPQAWLYALIWIAGGLASYRIYARGREREKVAPPVLAQEPSLETRPHSVLIPISDPRTMPQHIQLGAAIARVRDSELVLLHVIPVPPQLPPRAATRFVEEARPLLVEARRLAQQYDVPVSTLIRVGHDVSQAIVHTARDRHTDFLIMGWKGRRRRDGALIGRNIDRVLMDCNTHMIVMQRGEIGPGERILVPISNPKNAPLSLGIAALLSRRDSGEVRVVHISPEPLDEESRLKFREEITHFTRDVGWEPEKLFRTGTRFGLDFRVADNPVTEIIRLSSEFDRLILGSTENSLFHRRVLGRIPRRIARYAKCPVLLIRMRESGVLFGMQHFFQFFRDLEESGQPREGGKD